MITKQEALGESQKYFDGDSLAAQVWMNKYALKNQKGELEEKTPEDMHRRLAKEFARIESKYPNPMREEEIFTLLKDFKYIVPQGSPMFGIGNDYQTASLSNCYVVGNNSEADSYGSIMRTDEEIAQIYKRRGGCGLTLDHYRPIGAMANGSVLKSDAGATLYMDRFSQTTKEVAQSGRRGALMISISVKHPDVEMFIDKKLKEGKVTGANISVKITDEFMQAVKSDKDFIQTFPIDLNISAHAAFGEMLHNKDFEYGKLYDLQYENDDEYKGCYAKVIKAKTLWDKAIHNAWQSAEPGVLFWDKILAESPAGSYGKEWKEISTNPCGELPLNPYDSCRLTAINLYSYVRNPFEKGKASFDFPKFKVHVQKAQRLMDDLVDLEIEKLDKIIDKVKSDTEPDDIKRVELNLWQNIKEKAEQGRRTGLGIIAEGDMLAALGLRYGTKEATEFSAMIHKELTKSSYESSIKLAKERGAFPMWDFTSENENPFLVRVLGEIVKDDEEIYSQYLKTGRRNISNLTIAPTGSVSILTQTTSGIEPVFKVSYKRRKKTDDPKEAVFTDEVGDMWTEHNVFHHKFIEWWNKNWYKLNSTWHDLGYKPDIEEFEDKELNKMIEKSPYYKATSSDVDYYEKVRMQGEIQKWIDHSISVTVNMPEDVSKEIVSNVYQKAYDYGCKGVTIYREGSRAGVLVSKKEKNKDQVNYTDAPKRPQELVCDIYHKTALKKDWTACVGLLEGKPYEIFAFSQVSQSEFPKEIKRGKITRIKSGHYRLTGIRAEKEYGIENIIPLLSDDEKTGTRNYSAMLRHGIRPDFIHQQIEKFANINSFDKVISRVLSNYTNGLVKCQECGSKNVEMQDGCMVCKDCGSSKCG